MSFVVDSVAVLGLIDLRVESEKLMRVTKGRFLVARYRGGEIQNFTDPNALRPLSVNE